MAYKKKESIIIMGTDLIFRNFTGKGSDFNREGDRNTCIVIPEDRVQELIDKGYNVKFLEPKDPQEEKTYYLKINCRLDNIPPSIYMVTSVKTERLDVENDPDSVNKIDYCDIDSIDIEFTPFDWEKGGRSGRAAYLKTLYVKVVEDPFYEKYHFGDREED